ncbi:hypothetical protein K470DRAFT_124170 [Piedraia hortae CBS 480.64]|uniref:Uncharacterized protein n=1 Tax=Piedraia hortae CBS 480.64 TaxID=1314780 RepID=A0A6A7C9P1_9PEZI|nr:hypothetical protein K470DRAFT_124170 [Piedraia hortae CBS 480.64]
MLDALISSQRFHRQASCAPALRSLWQSSLAQRKAGWRKHRANTRMQTGGVIYARDVGSEGHGRFGRVPQEVQVCELDWGEKIHLMRLKTVVHPAMKRSDLTKTIAAIAEGKRRLEGGDGGSDVDCRPDWTIWFNSGRGRTKKTAARDYPKRWGGP